MLYILFGLTLLFGIALGVSAPGTAGMNGGSGSYTGADGYSVIAFTSTQVNGFYTIVYNFGSPDGIQVTLAGSLTLGLNGSITSNCGGSSSAQIEINRYEDDINTVIAYWPATSGAMVSLIVNDTVLPNAIYTVRITITGSMSCTVTVANVVFGFIEGPYPGPSGSSANLVGGGGSFTPVQNGLIGQYTSNSAEGSLGIARLLNIPLGISTEVVGLAFVWLNGTIYTTCSGFGGFFGSVRISRCDLTVLATFTTTSAHAIQFALEVADNVVPNNCWAATVYSVGSSTCTTTISGLNLGADQILINL